MASRSELLTEAYSRGLLTGEKKSQYEEAQKRGMVNSDSDTWQQTVSRWQRPVVQGVATGVGTALGFAAPVIGGSAIGGAGGWAIGNQAADVIDEQLGVKEPQNMADTAMTAAGYAREGIEGELLGHGMAKVAAPVARQVGKLYKGTRNIFSPQAELSDILTKLEGSTDPVKQAQARKIKALIPEFKATTGMQKGNQDLLAIERGAISSDKFPGARQLATDITEGNKTAIRGAVDDLTPGRTADFTGRAQSNIDTMDAARRGMSDIDAQAVGTQYIESISAAEKPIKATMAKLEDAIPDYPISFNSTRRVIKDILSSKKISDKERKAVIQLQSAFNERMKAVGETTHSGVGARRSLDELISEAFTRDQKSKVGATLMKVKNAMDADFSEVGKLARTGKVKTHNGAVVRPDDLATELEKNMEKIARIESSTSPDITAMQAALEGRGIRSASRVPGESEAGYLERLTNDYLKAKISPDVPMLGVNQKALQPLVERNQSIQKILSEVEPGQDVGAIYNAYNKYASNEYFGRFDQEAIKRAANKNTFTENITKNFTTPTGAQQLRHAIGPEQSADVMRGHFSEDFGRMLEKNPSDKAITGWFRKNRKVLNALGLGEEFNEIVKTQVGYNNLQKIVGADIESVFAQVLGGGKRAQRSALFPILRQIKGDQAAKNGLKKSFSEYLTKQLVKPGNTFVQVDNIFDQLKPTMEILYTPNERAKLGVIRDAIKMTQSLTSTTALGNSQTAELTAAMSNRIIGGKGRSKWIAGFMDMAIGGAAYKATGSPATGIAATTGARVLRDGLAKHSDDAVRRYFMKAATDPAFADKLIKITKGGKITEETAKALTREISRSLAYSSVGN